MSEPRQVEFDVDPATLADLLTKRSRIVLQFAALVVSVLAGVIAVVIDEPWLALVLSVLAVFWAALLWKMPRMRQSMALRLAGHTEIRFSDEGMDFRGANVAERVPWTRLHRLADWPDSWIFATKPPMAVFVLPKSAVPAAAQEHFTGQLADWSGPAYRLRRR